MGVSYKKLVYERTNMPLTLAAWAAMVLVYYYIFVIPGFVFGMALFHPEIYAEGFEGASLASAYAELGRGALPEALLTSIITTLVYLALPRRHRRPLW